MTTALNRFRRFLQKLSGTYIVMCVVFLGLFIYGNSLFNGFIADDFVQVVNNPSIRSFSYIPDFFIKGIHNESVGQANNYYKPMLYSVFTLIYALFNANSFGFHLVQLLIHICNAILLFALFTVFFKKNISFILSLLFLVHPINTEAVIYISALQENLFLFFGLMALGITLYDLPARYFIPSTSVFLLMSLFSKETGVVFLFLIPAFCFLIYKKKRMASILSSSLALLIYCIARFAIAKVFFNSLIVVPIMTLSFTDRLVHIPAIVSFYIKTFFYPATLLFFQDWIIQSVNLESFYLPLVVICVFFAGFIQIGYITYKKYGSSYANIFAFFFIWFILGICIHIQIIPLDQTVSDRWFYFPIVGLLGMLGMLMKILTHSPWYSRLYIPFFIFVLFIFSGRVIVRNMNWKNEKTLYTHDARRNINSYQLEIGLGNIKSNDGDATKAEQHYKRAVDLFPNVLSYNALGNFYLMAERYDNAITYYSEALRYDPNNAAAWAYIAISAYKNDDTKRAIKAAEKAYEIAPNDTFREVLRTIRAGEDIHIKN